MNEAWYEVGFSYEDKYQSLHHVDNTILVGAVSHFHIAN